MEDAKEMIERYNRRHGTALGCVYFSKDDISLNVESTLEDEIIAELENMSDFVVCAQEFINRAIA